MRSNSPAIARHIEILKELSEDSPYTVFLCGPNLSHKKDSSMLRKKIIDALKRENFDVVLGEDDGLEETRLSFGVNAQDNELLFIERCNAVIIIADSVGSHCELGLFTWHYVHKDGSINKMAPKPAFIVLINAEFKDHRSYLNEGPIASLLTHGYVDYVDYAKYDPEKLVKILKDRKILESQDRRGRPRGKK